jgi:hypothetical protein
MEFLASPWFFGSVCIVAGLIVFAILKVGSFKFKDLEVGLNDDDSTSTKDVPKFSSIMEIIQRTTAYIEKRQEIRQQLVEDQMRFYEEIDEEVQGELRRNFLSLLAEKLNTTIDSYAQHPEYISYLLTLKAISSDLKPYIRSCFKNNHYATQTAEDQRLYIDKKRIVLIQKVSDQLNLFWKGTIINRTELYKYNMKNIDSIENLIDSIFNRAFLLAREAEENLQKLEACYKIFLEREGITE